MSEILLPPMNVQQEAKTKRLVDLIGEYMGDPVKCESVISMRIIWPDDRVDMGLIFKKLAGNKKGVNAPAVEKGNGSKDELVQAAIDMLKGEKVTNSEKLRTELHIGFVRATRLMDELEKMGIVGPATTGKHGREVLAEKAEMSDEPLSEDG